MFTIRNIKARVEKAVGSSVSSARRIDLRIAGSDIKKALSSAVSLDRFVALYRRVRSIGKTKVNMRAAICSAIDSHRVIEFYYHGDFRLVEPFCLGEIKPRDGDTLLCYQVGGHIEFGEPVGWKLYRFSEMSQLTVTTDRFTGNRPCYDPYNLEMPTIYCCIPVSADEANMPEEIIEPVPVVEEVPPEEVSSYEKAEDIAVSLQYHGEQMKKFRTSHSPPVPPDR